MIITCASCLTKFNLDESRIPSKGAKVRCSRCRHVFRVFPTPEKREGTFDHGDDHEDLTERQREAPASLQIEEPSPEPGENEKEKKVKVFTAKKVVQNERKGPSLFLILFIIVVILVFVVFYLLTELGASGRLLQSLEYPIKKITELWQQIF